MRKLGLCLLVLSMLILPARGAEKPKLVALTFDDGPSGIFTQKLLDGLQERNAKATFLLCGYRIVQYPEVAQRIFDEGHEIGYHGYSHDSMKNMSRLSIAQELIDTQALLPEDCEPVFLRPPGGFITDGVRQVAEARQLAILSWSVDPKDWATNETARIEQAVLETVQDGDVILLHDMTMSSVRAALGIVDELQKRGFRFVTASELARQREMRIRPGKTYHKFPPVQESVK